MSSQTLASLKQIDPDALTQELRQKRDEIAQTTPDAMVVPQQPARGARMAQNAPAPEVMSKEAIEAAGRSARFVNIAAEYVGISAGAMQIAMASNAHALFDPGTSLRDFERIARKALAKALAEQDVTREACLLNGVEFETVNEELGKRGWMTTERGRPPNNGVNGDPAFAMKLAAHGIGRDKTIDHGVTPGKKMKNSELQLLLTQFPRFKRLIETKKIAETDLALQVACCMELQTCDAVEVADVERLGMMGSSARTPSATLAAVKQLRAARKAVEQAEQTSGGGLAGIKDQVIALKLRAGQRMLKMVRGPLNAVHSTVLVNAYRTHDLDAVSAATNQLSDLIRRNMATELAALFQANTIDLGKRDQLESELRMSRLEDVELELAQINANARPNTV
jgi:hypothetical protein